MKNLILFVVMLTLLSCSKESELIPFESNYFIETRSLVKYTLCHLSKDGITYNKMLLPENAVINHLKNHDCDRIPNDTVSFEGILYVLQEDCTLAFANPVDGDGNSYQSVIIGDQEWLTSNLKTTTYNDKSEIPNVVNNSSWGTLTSPAYSWYNNDSISYFSEHGAIYNYYTVADTNSKNVCPIGWHVPSYDEWETLVNYLGGADIAGGKLKEIGLTNWDSPNTGATNSSGFTSLASGNRNTNGSFDQKGHGGFYWSSTEYSIDRARYIWSQSNADDVYNNHNLKDIGFSIRCVKD